MSTIGSKYGFELWTRDGQLLADLSGRASNRTVTKIRNDADQISLSIDLNEYERFCSLNHVDPTTLIVNGQTEVRIKREGTYLAGGQVNYKNVSIDANKQTIDIKASGFLELLNNRYTDALREFTATEATLIGWTAIDESQQKPNGDFGIVLGPNQATVGPLDKTYQWTNLKALEQDLTNLQTGSFDLEITPDKKYNTYASIGSDRPDIIFEHPKNIISFQLPEDGTMLGNQVVAFGSGNGADAGVTVTVDDLGAQETVGLRQVTITTNGTDDSQGGVTDAANAQLAASAFPFEIPQIVVSGDVAPFITDYGIGDRVRVKLGGYGMTRHINGLYRIERFDLTVDDSDHEEITLYLAV